MTTAYILVDAYHDGRSASDMAVDIRDVPGVQQVILTMGSYEMIVLTDDISDHMIRNTVGLIKTNIPGIKTALTLFVTPELTELNPEVP